MNHFDIRLCHFQQAIVNANECPQSFRTVNLQPIKDNSPHETRPEPLNATLKRQKSSGPFQPRSILAHRTMTMNEATPLIRSKKETKSLYKHPQADPTGTASTKHHSAPTSPAPPPSR